MPVLVHGDAAFMGQGVVPETLNLAGLDGYRTHGTIHLVVNNQVGFTTNPWDARSTRYCTDIARMMRVPVFHVNGEDPEAVVQVARLAIEFRQQFGMDVVIDMYCYRKYGHNEGDEPRFTQPRMYSLIDKKPSVREMYVRRLMEMGIVTREQAANIVEERKRILDLALEEAKRGDFDGLPSAFKGVWEGFSGGPESHVPETPTAVAREILVDLAQRLAELPDGFRVNPKVWKSTIASRRDALVEDKPFDWGTAEQLAFATLLQEGTRVRLTGQDARRGTFAHRHAVLFDMETGEPYCPLAQLCPTPFEVFDSPLSEAGVLGFEYGYSLDYPDALVLWEAQFGDFANTAQVIIDQFLTSAEDKWMRLSGLVLLLPHGYEGQGPEHSSARIERFLQLAAEDNIQAMNLTTPAQLFHALRRQVHRKWRKPLVIFTPKSLLRLPAATSRVDDLAHGSFQRVIGDAELDKAGVAKSAVKRVLVCSGKVYYELVQKRAELGRKDIAILRMEQLYPISDAVKQALEGYPLDNVVWVQDEPRNMGAWYFLNARKDEVFGPRVRLTCVSRAESASPATGSKAAHDLEQRMLLDEAFRT
jgi:2-oxoglutarate dehydrogenase E1 component